jgi:putative phosphoesterase
MILGILADTHSLNIPSRVIERFKTVDLIIHAGDICDEATVKQLKVLAPLKAVQGNQEESALKKELPLKEIIVCDNFRIGITHGHLGESRDALKNAMSAFKNDKIDVVIFGHSHQALKEHIGSTLYFNPGTPNDASAKFLSYGLIIINAGKVKAEIVKI